MPSLPPLFLERLQKILPENAYTKALHSFEVPRSLSLRVNRLKTSPETVQSELSAFQLQPMTWYEDAFLVQQGTLRELQETEAYQQGRVYIQELSSMVPVLLLEPKPDESVLDLTAAPGSKTGQIAALMHNTGRILANDISRTRFFKMKANLESLGVTNVEYSVAKGENLGRKLAGAFDRVLLDAPCGGEGRFHLEDPASFENWKPAKIKALVPRQKMLFYSAWQALKPGGTMVYSTCTFAPEENEGILDWALEKFADLEIVTAALTISNRMNGLTQWGKKAYHPAVERALRILPDGRMEGFFTAKILKKQSVV